MIDLTQILSGKLIDIGIYQVPPEGLVARLNNLWYAISILQNWLYWTKTKRLCDSRTYTSSIVPRIIDTTICPSRRNRSLLRR
jgi:hypothetical protein